MFPCSCVWCQSLERLKQLRLIENISLPLRGLSTWYLHLGFFRGPVLLTFMAPKACVLRERDRERDRERESQVEAIWPFLPQLWESHHVTSTAFY